MFLVFLLNKTRKYTKYFITNTIFQIHCYLLCIIRQFMQSNIKYFGYFQQSTYCVISPSFLNPD